MSKNRWRYFRWTPRTAFITLMYVGIVPAAMGYAFSYTDVRSGYLPTCANVQEC